MNQISIKLILYSRRLINFITKVFLVFITVLYFIKQENDTYKYIDYSSYSEQTYIGFVVDLIDNSNLPFFNYSSTVSYQRTHSLLDFLSFAVNRFTLKFSQNYFIDSFNNLSQISSPEVHILKILHKKNIYHQSSDDKTAPVVFC